MIFIIDNMKVVGTINKHTTVIWFIYFVMCWYLLHNLIPRYPKYLFILVVSRVNVLQVKHRKTHRAQFFFRHLKVIFIVTQVTE